MFIDCRPINLCTPLGVPGTPKGVRNLVALDNYKHCTPNGVEFVACCAHPALAKAASRVKHDSVAVDHFSSVLSQTGGDN